MKRIRHDDAAKKNGLLRLAGAAMSGLLMAAALGAAEIPDPQFMRLYAETYRFSLGRPTAITLIDDGSAVLFLRSPGKGFVRDLFLFDPATGKESLLAKAETLLGGTEETLTAEEKARRERQRLAARGIARFWPMDGGKKLLIPLSGRLFVLEVGSGEVRELPVPAGAPVDLRPSPTGTHAAYVVAGDLYVLDLASGEEARLTVREKESVTWGLAEFVAQEEMDRDHGYWFSPDGKYLAVQWSDTADVGRIHLADAMHPEKTPLATPYPRPGETNAEVRLALIPVPTGDRVGEEPAADHLWVRWDQATYPYLNTVKWPEKGPLTIVVQNRLQTEQRVLAVDTETGATRTLLVEKDDAWINLDQDVPHWLADGSGFLWTTERSGNKQLELRKADGSLDRTLTSTDFGFRELVRVDEARGELVIRGSSDPTIAHLWRLPLAGDSPVQISRGAGNHSAKVAKNGELMVVTRAPADGPREIVVTDRSGKSMGVLASNTITLDYAPTTEWLTVGDQQLRTAVTRPRDFDPSRRYPVIVHVYAGPTSQMVQQTRDRYYLAQWFADNGFVVVSIDGRGTPNRGRDWQRAVKGDLITLPMADQVAAVEALGKRLPELDLERVGMFGWSFGGYASAMAVMLRGDRFKAAIAGAPVTDWQDYDTHYTERYLGLPQETPEAYAVSNVLTYADQLERPLMIVHGTADDNVLFVHALKMSDALFRAGKDHELVPLAGLTHMLTSPDFVDRLYGRMIAFFKQHLGSPTPKAPEPRGP